MSEELNLNSSLIRSITFIDDTVELPFAIPNEHIYDGCMTVRKDQQQAQVLFNVIKEIVSAFNAEHSSERKHAHWFRPWASECVCSNCNKVPKMLFGMLPDFCPWCGAEMDEEVSPIKWMSEEGNNEAD